MKNTHEAIIADHRPIKVACTSAAISCAQTALHWIAQKLVDIQPTDEIRAFIDKIHSQSFANLDAATQMTAIELPIGELYQVAVALRMLANSQTRKGDFDQVHAGMKAEAARGYDLIKAALSEHGYDLDAVLN